MGYSIVAVVLGAFCLLQAAGAQVTIDINAILGDDSPTESIKTSSGDEITRLQEISSQEREEVLSKGREINEKLDEVKILYNKLATRLNSLATDEEGKRLSKNVDLIAQYVSVLLAYKNQALNIKSITDRVQTLLAPVQETESSTYRVSDSLTQGINNELKSVNEQLKFFVALENRLNNLIEAGVEPTPSTPTLKEMITKVRRDRTVQEAQKAAVRDEKKWQKQQAALDRKAEMLASAEAARIIREAQYETLYTEASDPSVQAKFRPFLDKGEYELRGSGKLRKRGGGCCRVRERCQYPRGKEQPVSFSKLQNFLDTDERLAYLVKDSCGGRATWATPTTAEGWAEITRRREQLLKLGPVWVEMELLLP